MDPATLAGLFGQGMPGFDASSQASSYQEYRPEFHFGSVNFSQPSNVLLIAGVAVAALWLLR